MPAAPGFVGSGGLEFGMREIKFRGKRLESPDRGEWITGHYWEYLGRHWIKSDGADYKVDPETIGQYTGLKDKNGKAPKGIYDKDILCCDGINDDYQTYAEVFWDAEYGQWKANHYDGNEVCEYELWALLQEFRFVDVAGNTHENPELLK